MPMTERIRGGGEKAYFFCDLDHTLLYSRRVPLPAGSRVVETLSGAPQSFMTERTYKFFRTQAMVRLVPTTTRSPEQYRRLGVLGGELPISHALICNGGVLLQNGREDMAWREETLTLLAPVLGGLEEARRTVERLAPHAVIHDVESLFFYLRCDEPRHLALRIRRALPSGGVQVLHDSRKLYCLPRGLDKGTAVSRFKKRFRVEESLAAGDSEFDVPMLNAVDTALFPPALQNLVTAGERVPVESPVFSDGICDYLESRKR